MSEERNFYEEAGYEMPDNVEAVSGEGGFEYYKFPIGTYRMIFGKLKPLYRNINNESCDSTTPGARLTSFQNFLWATEYLGTSTNPNAKNILVVTDKEIQIPNNAQMAELYYSNFISYLPQDQWKEHKKFESFIIPGHENIRIISPDPNNPSKKITNFKYFPHYYGFYVEVNLVSSSKGNVYIDSMKFLADKPRVSPELLKQLENTVDMKIKMEIESRKNKNNEGYKPNTIDTDDVSSFMQDNSHDDDGLESFLNQ